jgi:hypothetical protein
MNGNLNKTELSAPDYMSLIGSNGCLPAAASISAAVVLTVATEELSPDPAIFVLLAVYS